MGAYPGSLEGRVAIVTGAAQGQGAAVARMMAERGAKVLVTDIEDTLGQEVANSIGANARYAHLDTANKKSWEEAVKAAEDAFGTVSILANSAGVFRTCLIEDLTEEDYLISVRVNQIGPFLGVQAVLPGMKRLGGGSIVITSSLANRYAVTPAGAYSATKAAVSVMVRVAARELGQYNIRINSIAPGAIDRTTMFAGVAEELREGYKARIPLARFGTPEDIARLACFLASDESSWITGEEVTIDGGMTSTQ
jgi:3alpha(or 20beta)-hydroxysteroid dehydrogenase